MLMYVAVFNIFLLTAVLQSLVKVLGFPIEPFDLIMIFFKTLGSPVEAGPDTLIMGLVLD